MTELANFVTEGMPNNYNAVQGFAMNPYDPRRDPRPATADGRAVLNTGGSSSGAGTAANFWAANVGTETSGSILSPSNQNMLVGIKPTVGRISRYGVIPISADQDTAGPMAKSVTDAAILFGALESTSPDPNDPATKTCQAPPNRLSDGDRSVGLFVPQPPLPGGAGPAPAPYPNGFILAPAPYGVSFTGTACSEPRLIELAYAFEQATKRAVICRERQQTAWFCLPMSALTI